MALSYTEATDLFTFDSGMRQQSSERVTPHKMSLLILIFEFKQMCAMEHSDDPSLIDYSRVLGERDKRNFMLLLLELLQSPDMDLKTLRCRIEPIMKETMYQALYDLLREISMSGVKPIHDFFETNSTLLTTSDFECVVRRESIVGLFIRRMELAYNEMSFSQVVETYKKVRRYYEAGFPELQVEHTEDFLAARVDPRNPNPLGLSRSALTMSVLDEKSTIESLAGRDFFSKKQAEYFIANQSLLLNHNEGKALPPDQLQQKITSILSANPDLAEAHFLSYMNCLRIKEYCTAIQNLYHYFLHTSRRSGSSAGDENKKKSTSDDVASRYATLNLASLQYRFGNRQECKAALKEAIHMAQDSKDDVCLQHTLMWLNLLEDSVSVGQLECSIKKMFDLSLPALSVLGYNSLSRRLVNCGEKPARVMNLFTESNLTNCHHSNYSMMASGFAHRGMLWNLFGNRELSLLDSQIVLNLNTSINSVYYCGQAVCIAMCSMAQQHADAGQYQASLEMLDGAKKSFPSHLEECRIWQSCLQQISFTRAVLHGRLMDAHQILMDLWAVDETEARLRKPTLLRAQGEVEQAFCILEDLLKEQQQPRSQWSADAYCRVLLELSDLLMATGNHSSALLHITQCIAKARKHHLELYTAMGTVYLGFIQLHLQLPEQGIGQIESQLIKIYTNASAYDKARVLFAYAKCKVASAAKNKKEEAERNKEWESAVELVTTATKLFHSVEAHHREKDSTYYLALLYHRMGNADARNKCSNQFNKLDQLYPTLTSSGVLAL